MCVCVCVLSNDLNHYKNNKVSKTSLPPQPTPKIQSFRHTSREGEKHGIFEYHDEKLRDKKRVLIFFVQRTYLVSSPSDVIVAFLCELVFLIEFFHSPQEVAKK